MSDLLIAPSGRKKDFLMTPTAPGEIPEGTYTALYNELEKLDPDLWKICYPRVYEDVHCGGGQYYSPKSLARTMLGNAAKFMGGVAGDSEKYELLAFSAMVRCGIPLYWVSPGIMEAMSKTKPPVDVNWTEMKLPFEAAAFMIPKGTFQHLDPAEGEFRYIAYARVAKGESPTALTEHVGFPVASRNGGFIALASTKGEHLIHWIMPENEQPIVNLRHLDQLILDYSGPKYEHRSGWSLHDVSMTDADNHTIAAVTHYIFCLLLLMLARPEVVTGGNLIKRVPAKKGKQAREFWSPRIIGEHYKMRGLRPESLGGTHASPRLHFVQGYYNLYHVGAGREQQLVKFVDPYWRGGKVEENE